MVMSKSQALDKLDQSRIFAKNKSSELITFLRYIGLESVPCESTPWFFISGGSFRRVSVDEFYTSDMRELSVESVLSTEIVASYSKGDILVTPKGRIFMLSKQEGASYWCDGLVVNNKFFSGEFFCESAHKANAAQIAKFNKVLRENGIKVVDNAIVLRKRLDYYYWIMESPLLDNRHTIVGRSDTCNSFDDLMYEVGNYFATEDEAKEYLAK